MSTGNVVEREVDDEIGNIIYISFYNHKNSVSSEKSSYPGFAKSIKMPTLRPISSRQQQIVPSESLFRVFEPNAAYASDVKQQRWKERSIQAALARNSSRDYGRGWARSFVPT